MKLSRLLLASGICSSFLYACMDVIGGLRWTHYNWLSQEFSRLSAVGAPSRPIHLVLSPIYSLLVIAFGLGIWLLAEKRNSLRVIGGALIVFAICSWMWPQFFPEDLSQSVSAFTNTMHIVLTFVTVLTWILILSFAAHASSKWFRIYSVLTLLLVVTFGALAGAQGSELAAGQPTPWLGLSERISIYSFMLWVIALSILLRRDKKKAALFTSPHEEK